MALPETDFITEKEYLALDLDSDMRYEYRDGRIFAMAGASREHNVITSNVHISLGTQLANKPCEIYQSDMRVKTKADAGYRYPDIVVVCADPVFLDTNPVSLTNPTLIIEVLSDSTADKDRDEKFREYRHMASVQEYLIISQDSPRIERYFKQDNFNWLYTELSGLEQKLALKSISCVLEFNVVFRRIDFDKTHD